MSQVMPVEKDDKRIITEVAFGVEPKLLGTKLATPIQRGVAMLVDAFLVLLLTDVSGVFWGLLVGLAFFRAGRRRDKVNWRLTRLLVRLLGSLVIFISVLVMVTDMTTNDNSANKKPDLQLEVSPDGVMTSKQVSIQDLLSYGNLTADIVSFSTQLESDCDQICVEREASLFLSKLVESGVPQSDALDIIEAALPDDVYPTEAHKAEFLAQMTLAHKTSKVNDSDMVSEVGEASMTPNLQAEGQRPTNIAAPTGNKNAESENSATESSSVKSSAAENKSASTKDKAKQPVYSLVEYTKALIADLGLGFGWAALYFTAFSAWWRGQTPGKKLMGIRVIQLDGTYMSAWEAFGRYGGYGAGFATGLTGFLQIFWDPNRQAIQDKISATVVIQGDIGQNVQENE